ncbi:ester cyclase [Lacticaseibacillus songhuajiangensis]|jgi:predicted ester cyclase|uniref:ester cyclase n=1 Tax=Lacticaseibacillus songhuajiangensis TaxID=1296539 RepID=UPI000F777D50|nr:ester cyclase [Lacticaseibacillus songhuajiangensis]
MINTQLHKDIVTKLIAEALPNNDVAYVESVVTPETVTRRAGFASLLQATDQIKPAPSNFMDWVRNGWDSLHAALSEQKVTMREVVADGNQVIAHYTYTAKHAGTFASAPATGKTIHWDEIGIFKFNNDDKLIDMWYMIDELRVAEELGHQLLQATK